jgi:hypothetical protein
VKNSPARRATFGVLTSTAALGGAVMLSAPPAVANGYTPSGCQTWAKVIPFTLGWNSNCTAGSNGTNYINNGGYVWAIQDLTSSSTTALSWDATLQASVKNYQTAHSLTSDGIVGVNTWNSMASQMTSCGGTIDLYDQSVPNTDPNGLQHARHMAGYSKSAAECAQFQNGNFGWDTNGIWSQWNWWTKNRGAGGTNWTYAYMADVF